MHEPIHRRDVLRRGVGVTLGGALCSTAAVAQGQREPAKDEDPLFRISLAQWSLNKRLFGKVEPKLDNLDFAKSARAFGIEAVEYVNRFFKDKIGDRRYLKEMRVRAEGEGVRSLLIMCDGLGRLGDPRDARRAQAVENHVPALEAAWYLGCHSIRVNAASAGSFEEQQKLAADGLARLADKGAEYGLNVIVENHGGLSSNGEWLAGVIRAVGKESCGTLPDFGNFRVGRGELYDRYKGVRELMPFAKAVSAKAHDFDAAGNEIHTDYFRMMRIVLDAGYRGWVGIEYEGRKLSEEAGITATKRLLERVRARLAKAYR